MSNLKKLVVRLCVCVILVIVLLQILVPWNNNFCNIVLPVSGFFLVPLYSFDYAGPMLPSHNHIIILDGLIVYKPLF